MPNWLDTAGYKQGTIYGRWYDCDSCPTPTLTRVKLADLRKHLPADGSVTVQELTSARATINLAGPLSRQILAEVAGNRRRPLTLGQRDRNLLFAGCELDVAAPSAPQVDGARPVGDPVRAVRHPGDAVAVAAERVVALRGLDSVRFKRPVRIGETLNVQAVVRVALSRSSAPK